MDATAAMKPKHYVTCAACGWVHWPISRAYAEESVMRFNSFYDAAPAHVRESYLQRSDISQYEHCFRCGAPHTEMVKSKPEDCPTGVTLQPIIWSGVFIERNCK